MEAKALDGKQLLSCGSSLLRLVVLGRGNAFWNDGSTRACLSRESPCAWIQENAASFWWRVQLSMIYEWISRCCLSSHRSRRHPLVDLLPALLRGASMSISDSKARWKSSKDA